MTITTPWRRITLQLSQRGFTDARTFTLSLLTYEHAVRLRALGSSPPRRTLEATIFSPSHQLEANNERRWLQRCDIQQI
jgi:hypothetical protein